VSDRWISIGLSVLLHAALLAALVYGWLLFRRPPRPAPTLAIEATVVDARSLRGAQRPPPQPTPPAAAPQPPPESEGPPQPTPEELAQREEQRRQAEAAADAERHAAEQKAAEQKAADEAARRAEEQRKAREAEAQKRNAEERQRQADAQAAREAAREAEADLKRGLAAEEQAAAARSGPALANWQAQIAAKITRAWLRPPTARSGIECMLYVTQVPGGEVTQVRIGQCNGDQAVRESIEAAVYRASPLPPPPDPALFDRNLRINFKPD
jgi:colicin import membrane protein